MLKLTPAFAISTAKHRCEKMLEINQQMCISIMNIQMLTYGGGESSEENKILTGYATNLNGTPR